MASVLSLLLALARAIPAVEALFRGVVAQRDQDREREARNRLTAKDAAVDAALGDDLFKP